MDLTQFVEQFYQMDPMAEALLANGRMLKDGMIVLIADPELRWNPHRIVGDISKFKQLIYNASVKNRWCIVSEIEVVENNVYFTGTYDDGEQVRRKYSLLDSWLVKRNGLNEDDYMDFKPAIIEQPKSNISYLDGIKNKTVRACLLKEQQKQRAEAMLDSGYTEDEVVDSLCCRFFLKPEQKEEGRHLTPDPK